MIRIFKVIVIIMLALQVMNSGYANDHNFGNVLSQDIKAEKSMQYKVERRFKIVWKSISQDFIERAKNDESKYILKNAIDTSKDDGKVTMGIFSLTERKVVSPTNFTLDNSHSLYILSATPNYLFKFNSRGELKKTLKLKDKNITFIHYYKGNLILYSYNKKLLVCDTNSLECIREINLKSHGYQSFGAYKNYVYFFGNSYELRKNNEKDFRMIFDLSINKFIYGSKQNKNYGRCCFSSDELCCNEFYKDLFSIKNRNFSFIAESERYTALNFLPELGSEDIRFYILDKTEKNLSPINVQELKGVVENNRCYFKDENTIVILDNVVKNGFVYETIVYIINIF